MSDAVIKPTCQFIRENNQQCKLSAETNSRFCWMHAPIRKRIWNWLIKNRTAAFLRICFGLLLSTLIGMPSVLEFWHTHFRIPPFQTPLSVALKLRPPSAPLYEPGSSRHKKAALPHPVLLGHAMNSFGKDSNGLFMLGEEFPSGFSATTTLYIRNDGPAIFKGGYLEITYEKGFAVTCDHTFEPDSSPLESGVRGIVISVRELQPKEAFPFRLRTTFAHGDGKFTQATLYFKLTGEQFPNGFYISDPLTVRNAPEGWKPR